MVIYIYLKIYGVLFRLFLKFVSDCAYTRKLASLYSKLAIVNHVKIVSEKLMAGLKSHQ